MRVQRLLDVFRDDCDVYKKTICPSRDLLSHTLRYIFAKNSFIYTVLLTSILRVPFFSSLCFIFNMTDEIQPITGGARADVETEVADSNDHDEGGELVLDSGC